jgi:hypothetical protein
MYPVGAGPVVPGFHSTAISFPNFDALKSVGVGGAPEQAPGNVSVTEFEAGLEP